MKLLKNSSGKPSFSFTMSLIAFVLVSLWLLAWIVGPPLGLTISAFDSASAMAYLTPILALYFGRRWTDSKEEPKE